MLRRRRRRDRGAMALITLSATASLAAGGVAILEYMGYAVTDERATSAGDAAAHAAETAVMSDPDLEGLSIAAQAGETTCERLDDQRCAPFIDAARHVAEANGALLLAFRLGPDLRDRRPGPGAGRLTSLVKVAVRRRLALTPPCTDSPGDVSDGCWAITFSAAEQVNAPPPR